MKILAPGSLIVATMLSASPVFAQTATVPAPAAKAPHARRSFFNTEQKRADLPAHIERLFKQLDLNRDGFISRDEIAASQAKFDDRMTQNAPKRAAKLFDRLDTNHDGQITRAEVEARAAARLAARGKTSRARKPAGSALFARADANKDGIITRPEFNAAVDAGKIKLRHANMRGSAIVRMFDLADVNHDGRVSLDEAQQAALKQFDSADTNHDGVLAPDERRAASKSHRAKRKNS